MIQELPVKKYIELAISDGCLACALDGNPGTPAEWHHPMEEAGMSEKGPDEDGYSLCPIHHRGVGIKLVPHENLCSIHMNPIEFKLRYGDDKFMAKMQRIVVQRTLDNSIGMRRA